MIYFSQIRFLDSFILSNIYLKISKVKYTIPLIQVYHDVPSSTFTLRSIMHLIFRFFFLHNKTSIPPSAVSLLGSLHSFPTQSLTECALFLRTYRIPPPCSGSALTQALLCNPCPLPPRPPARPIYFFSKFSFPCGSIRSLKSAFIIEGLSVLEEQVSPA